MKYSSSSLFVFEFFMYNLKNLLTQKLLNMNTSGDKLKRRDKDTGNWKIFQNYNKVFWMHDFSLVDANKK